MSKTERPEPLNPLSGLSFGPGLKGLGYIMDPNPAHYNLMKEEEDGLEFHHSRYNSSKEKEGRFEKTQEL